MKQILGLDFGAVAFTPGTAGVGTLVISGVTDFAPARLMAVTNVTRRALIYIAEVTDKGGVWSSVTATGGTVTLDMNTTSHSSGDVLRCLYESDTEAALLTAMTDQNELLLMLAQMLPRITSTKQMPVSIEAGSVGISSAQTLATVTTVGTVTTVSNMNSVGGQYVNGQALNSAGLSVIYNQIQVT
jgi:hypothetical protein